MVATAADADTATYVHRNTQQEEEDAADYASGLAADLFFYQPQHVLAGQYLYDDWDPALVRS